MNDETNGVLLRAPFTPPHPRGFVYSELKQAIEKGQVALEKVDAPKPELDQMVEAAEQVIDDLKTLGFRQSGSCPGTMEMRNEQTKEVRYIKLDEFRPRFDPPPNT